MPAQRTFLSSHGALPSFVLDKDGLDRVHFTEFPPAATAFPLLPNGKTALVAMHNPVSLKHRPAEREAHAAGVATRSFREYSARAAVAMLVGIYAGMAGARAAKDSLALEEG